MGGGGEGQQPWVQQTGGCGRQGELLHLPLTALLSASTNSSSRESGRAELGQSLADLWIRLRYGVYGELDSPQEGGSVDGGGGSSAISIVSRQAAECQGATVRQVVFRHPDFAQPQQPTGTAAPSWNTSFAPQIIVKRQVAPRLVIVLENSVAMNQREEWDYVRAACKKFLLHDLPPEAEVGLVLFNDEAHVATNVVRLGRRMAAAGPRNELAFAVKSKHHLSARTGSCVRCGVAKAIEALQAGRTGGALIIISRGGGGGSGLAQEEERELRRLSAKHAVQLFPITIGQPAPPVSGEQWAGLERLAHFSLGNSWLLAETSYLERPSLSIYMGLVDALREIQARVLPLSAPHLVSYHTWLS